MVLLGFQYALRERMRFALTTTGITSAVVLTVFLAGVYRGAVHGSLSYLKHAGGEVWVGSRGSWNLMRSSGFLPGTVRDSVAGVDGVGKVESILAALLPAKIDGRYRSLLVLGLEGGAVDSAPKVMVCGSSNPGPDQVIIDAAFARRSGLSLKDTLELAGRTWRISGISRETNLLVTQYAFIQIVDLREMLGLDGQASFLLVRANPESVSVVVDGIRQKVPDSSVFDAATFLDNNRREIASGFLPVLWAIAFLGLAVGSVVVALTTHVAVVEKRADYAVLAALGGTERTRSAVVLEQALVAAVAGCLTGLAVLAGLQRCLPYLVPEVEFRLDLWLAAAAFLGSVAVASCGALLPARLAAHIPPMEAFKR